MGPHRGGRLPRGSPAPPRASLRWAAHVAVPPARSKGRDSVAQRGPPQGSRRTGWAERAEGPSLPCRPSEAARVSAAGSASCRLADPAQTRTRPEPRPAPPPSLTVEFNVSFCPDTDRTALCDKGLGQRPGASDTPRTRRASAGDPGSPSVREARLRETAAWSLQGRQAVWLVAGRQRPGGEIGAGPSAEAQSEVCAALAVFSGGIRHSLNIIHLSFV